MLQVKTDKFGRMDTNNLKTVLKKVSMLGTVPFFINASAGTPIFGAIDPLRKIIKICTQWDLWIHVDVRMQYKRYNIKNIIRTIGKQYE